MTTIPVLSALYISTPTMLSMPPAIVLSAGLRGENSSRLPDAIGLGRNRSFQRCGLYGRACRCARVTCHWPSAGPIPGGGNRAQYVANWNLRFSPQFGLPVGRSAVSADVLNLTDSAQRLREHDLSSSSLTCGCGFHSTAALGACRLSLRVLTRLAGADFSVNGILRCASLFRVYFGRQFRVSCTSRFPSTSQASTLNPATFYSRRVSSSNTLNS
jgi:hypothetical protein